VRAIHIELDTKTFDKDKKCIEELYAQSNTVRDFPLGASMRLIPDIRELWIFENCMEQQFKAKQRPNAERYNMRSTTTWSTDNTLNLGMDWITM